MNECMCVPGNYVCGDCRSKENKRVEERLTQVQKDYDYYVTLPSQGDDDEHCFCHLSAPCAYCMEPNEKKTD